MTRAGGSLSVNCQLAGDRHARQLQQTKVLELQRCLVFLVFSRNITPGTFLAESNSSIREINAQQWGSLFLALGSSDFLFGGPIQNHVNVIVSKKRSRHTGFLVGKRTVQSHPETQKSGS